LGIHREVIPKRRILANGARDLPEDKSEGGSYLRLPNTPALDDVEEESIQKPPANVCPN
jgi:hypothetical protein